MDDPLDQLVVPPDQKIENSIFTEEEEREWCAHRTRENRREKLYTKLYDEAPEWFQKVLDQKDLNSDVDVEESCPGDLSD